MGKTFEELNGLVVDWAEDRNIIGGSTVRDQYIKAVSEMGELGDAILKNNKDEVEDAIGDVMVCLINLSKISDISMIACLEGAYDVIKTRKGVMWNGSFVKDTDPNYERIKKHLNGEIDEKVRTDH